MADLFDVKGGKLIAFISRLAELGITPEIVCDLLDQMGEETRQKIEPTKGTFSFLPTVLRATIDRTFIGKSWDGILANAALVGKLGVMLAEGGMNPRTLELLLRGVPLAPFIVDGDALPTSGGSIRIHRKIGSVDLTGLDIDPFVFARQRAGQPFSFQNLADELGLFSETGGKRVLNANVLDAFLAHPEFIPSAWDGKSILFLGTIFWGALSWHGDEGPHLYCRILQRGQDRKWGSHASYVDTLLCPGHGNDAYVVPVLRDKAAAPAP